MILFKPKELEFIELDNITLEITQRYDMEHFINTVLSKYYPTSCIKYNGKINTVLFSHIRDLCHIIE